MATFHSCSEIVDMAKQVEMAGFLTVADNKLSELRIVTDLTAFNDMRTAAGLPALD